MKNNTPLPSPNQPLVETVASLPLVLPSPLLWPSSVGLPQDPGVYWFLNASNDVLYVGKAKNLKNRLTSYKRLNQLLPRTRKLVGLIATVKFEVTETELEALLLEAELIRTHQPDYNVLLKDDKSPLYIGITKESFPRVLTVRKGNLPTTRGEYSRIFGPYPSGYQVRQILKLVRKAFPYCNAPTADKKRHKPCFYSHLGLCSGACTGRVSQEEYQKIIEGLILFLTGKKKLILQTLKKDIDAFAEAKNFEAAAEVKQQFDAILYITTHYKSKLEENPLPNLTADKAEHQLIHLRRTLRNFLSLPANLKINRIETYDVSNTQGTNASVSMVVFTKGMPDKSQYKHFRIKTLSTPNDTGMLKEALQRRMNHPEWGVPDLIIIDGGKGQVRVARNVVSPDIPVVGIAKHPDRLVIPLKTDSLPYAIIPLTKENPASGLIQHTRDEAHRFAKRYHSLLRTKNLLHTPGV